MVLSLEPSIVEVFSQVGRLTWPSFVAHRLPLLGLPEEVRAALRSAQLPYTKARLIARITPERVGGDEAKARKLRRDLIQQSVTEGLSVRDLQREIAALLGRSAEPTPKPAQTAGDTPLDAKLASLREKLGTVDVASLNEERRARFEEAVEALLEEL